MKISMILNVALGIALVFLCYLVTIGTVSYTLLTLPTNREAQISVEARILIKNAAVSGELAFNIGRW